jgi:glyoxylase-like metal-dependent hydrolase (beta-lactamase superfamily II)
MLIDTLFDLRGARTLLDALAKITAEAPIGAAVNTHGNGDHCFGNQLLPAGIPIHATRAAEAEIRAAPPAVIVEERPAPPSGEYIWIDGYWHWDARQYIWQTGHWDRPPHANFIWVAPRYERHEQDYRYTPGQWREDQHDRRR